MPNKNLFQDMVKVKRSKLVNKKPAIVRTSRPEPEPEEISDIEIEREVVRRPKRNIEPEYVEPTGKSRSTLWIVAFISFAFFFFSLSYLFAKVSVSVEPRLVNVTLDQDISAVKDGTNDTLPFDIVAISGEETLNAEVGEAKDVSVPAEGEVILYNKFSGASQALNIDTRLEGSNGKMYKTKTKIVIPGMVGTTPGSVKVNIYASEPGPASNSEPLDFNIFGFKGSPKYTKFYGRSTGPISGGLVGKVPYLTEDQKSALKDKVKESLSAKLFRKANEQIPKGVVLFKDATSIVIDDTPIDLSLAQNNILPVKMKGTLYGVLFNEEKLTKEIAKENIKKYDDSPVFIPNMKDIKFSLSSKDSESFETIQNLSFHLTGDINLVYKLDIDSFTASLLDRPKKEFNQILLKYPSIDSAHLSIRPFWKTTFPDKFKNIEVIVNYPK